MYLRIVSSCCWRVVMVMVMVMVTAGVVGGGEGRSLLFFNKPS